MTYQSLVSFEYWTLIAQFLNFFKQIYLFKRFLFNPVQNIIKQRQAQADNVIKEAETAREEALSSKEAYEAHLKTARSEAEEITARAVASAQERSEQILSAAQEDAAALRAKAARDIELDRRKAMNDAKSEISGMAVEIAAKLVNKEIDEKSNQALIDQFISEYEGE